MPETYRTVFHTRQAIAYNGENISCHFIPYSESLPKFVTTDDKGNMSPKSYKVPVTFKMERILNYLYRDLNVKEFIMDTNRD